MKRKFHVKISFKWFDFWMGVFVDVPGKTVYVCIIPMFPVKLWFTEHLLCPDCGAPMDKCAVDTGDGWALFWECDECLFQGDEGHDIEWPFGDKWMTHKDMQEHGYTVV